MLNFLKASMKQSYLLLSTNFIKNMFLFAALSKVRSNKNSTELKKCTFLIKKNLIAYEAERVTKTLENRAI